MPPDRTSHGVVIVISTPLLVLFIAASCDAGWSQKWLCRALGIYYTKFALNNFTVIPCAAILVIIVVGFSRKQFVAVS